MELGRPLAIGLYIVFALVSPYQSMSYVPSFESRMLDSSPLCPEGALGCAEAPLPPQDLVAQIPLPDAYPSDRPTAGSLAVDDVLMQEIVVVCPEGSPGCGAAPMPDSEFRIPVGATDDPAPQGVPENIPVTKASVGFSTDPCPTTDISTITDIAAIQAQISICANDFRTNPAKYAAEYPQGGLQGRTCTYQADIAPTVNDGKGRRLPLTFTGTSSSNSLNAAAQWMSQDSANRNFLPPNHVSSDGRTIVQRLVDFGWPGLQSPVGYAAGENLAGGFPNIRLLFLAWMCSATHRPNLMACFYNEQGSGYIRQLGTSFTHFYTQDFACVGSCNSCTLSPAPPPPILVPATSPPPPPPPPPPPLAPPPPASCSPQIPSAYCGGLDGNDQVLVRDNGDGTCTHSAIISGASSFGACNTLIYNNANCPNLIAALTLVMARRRPQVPYVQPDFNKWLTQMGIGRINILLRALTVYVDHVSSPVPAPVTPSFLSSMTQVGAIVVKECATCFGNPDIAPPSRALAGLPGLVNVRQMRDFGNGVVFLGSLIVVNTGLPSMASFSGLRCSPGLTQILDNPSMVTLSGLEGVAYPFWRPGATAVIRGNPLTGSPAVAPLRVMAGCPTGSTSTQPSGASVSIPGACTLSSWDSICSYIAFGCP